tara:strand:+ start:1194 stop:2396 length:1203 start_codon:yes stop_codon:yes gene_type:complete
MASSRDDFIIAIRSAFLKKSTQQKFSLLTLVLVSIFVIFLSSFDFRVIRILKIGINEFVYRSSFVISIPENFIKDTLIDVVEYSTFYNNYRKDKDELNKLRSKNISSEIIQYENKELKELINDYVSSSDKVLAKIIVDRDSPFLKSIIINKGSKDNIKIGTNIYDKAYLVGRVIEVNYKTSRVLLLSDLNSNVPVTIAPQNIQAIITGSDDNFGEIKYVRDGLSEEFSEKSIVYTSGTGAIFRSGIPIGKLKFDKKKTYVEFYSDFSQLKYVFAEVFTKKDILDSSNDEGTKDKNKNPMEAKIKILEDEKKIIEDSNLKFKEENENLKSQINNLENEILDFQSEILSKKNIIKQFNIDKEELKFLRLNLEHGHKCRKTFLNPKGFIVGTDDYKNCVLSKE